MNTLVDPHYELLWPLVIIGCVVIFILVLVSIFLVFQINKTTKDMALMEKDFEEKNKKLGSHVTRYVSTHSRVVGNCYLIVFASTKTKFGLYDAYRESVVRGWFDEYNGRDLFLFLDTDTKFVYRKNSMTMYSMYVNGNIISVENNVTKINLGDMVVEFDNVKMD